MISKDALWDMLSSVAAELKRLDPENAVAAEARDVLDAPRNAPADLKRAYEIRDCYLAGQTLRQIGDYYEITGERVRQILRKLGVPSLGYRPEHQKQPHELTETEIRAADLYNAGVRPLEIARQTGLPKHTISRIVRRQGFEVRGRGKWNTRPDDAEVTQRVCELYRAGKTAPEIVASVPRLKFPETVYRYLKKGGVAVRNPGVGNFRRNRELVGREA